MIIKIILFIVHLCAVILVSGQTQNSFFFKNYFDVSSKKVGNQNFNKKIFNLAERANPVNFQYLSYQIDARNNMYLGTGEIGYMLDNYEIIKKLFQDNNNEGLNWKVKSSHSKYDPYDGQEMILYEGYLLRYVSDYLRLVRNNEEILNKKAYSSLLAKLESRFLYWYSASKKGRGDDSFFHGIRVHMGANWASTALLLYELSTNVENKKVYKIVYNKFDQALRNNLNIKRINGYPCYVWNSTWDKPFTDKLNEWQKNKREKPLVQDVTHGNHIVQYAIYATELQVNGWSRNNLQYFANTLKFIIWNGKTKSFSDLVNGSKSISRDLRNTGWKQSDGWMKLISIDQSLKDIYKEFYNSNASYIDSSYLNSQYYSNFVRYF